MLDFLTGRQSVATKLLTECCLQALPATVLSPTSGLVCHGRFQSLDRTNVLIRFNKEYSPLLSEPMCCVTFQYEGRARAFFTHLSGVIDRQSRDVAFALPDEIRTAERRHSLRVPATPDCPAHVRIESKLTFDPGPGMVVNLGLAGVLVDFHSASVLHGFGSRVAISIACGRDSVRIASRAVRQDRVRCAFAFENPIASKASKGLIKILRRMEDAWTTERAIRSGNQAGLIDLISAQ
ncbi:MAG: hypothetical protein AAFU85_03040 [Planctomycetota bacterium]